MKKLTQEIFNNQPENVNWCGVDYDGLLSFGSAINPRYTWASERWRGFDLIGDPVENSGYIPLTSLYKGIPDIPIPTEINYNEIKHVCISGISCNLCDSIEYNNGKRCECVIKYFSTKLIEG